jgi:hypothetical protein
MNEKGIQLFQCHLIVGSIHGDDRVVTFLASGFQIEGLCPLPRTTARFVSFDALIVGH